MKKYKALGENVLIELVETEVAYGEYGVAKVNEKYGKAKVGKAISIGNDVPDFFKLGNEYVITQFLGIEIPDPKRKLVLINYNHIGMELLQDE